MSNRQALINTIEARCCKNRRTIDTFIDALSNNSISDDAAITALRWS